MSTVQYFLYEHVESDIVGLSHEFKDDAGHQLFTETFPGWDKEAGVMARWSQYVESSFGQWIIPIISGDTLNNTSVR